MISATATGVDALPTSGRGSRMLGKKLTAKQQAVADLKDAGKTTPEVAAALGRSQHSTEKIWTVINKKRGVKRAASGGILTERHDPEKVAAAIDAVTEPPGTFDNLKEAFARAGLPEIIAQSVMRRIRTRYFGVVTEIRALKTAELLDVINKKIHLASLYLDDKAFAEASARDLMLGISALVEKRQLLLGEPTQIISDHERKKLHELLPAFIEEARRRGVTVEGQVMAKEISSG